jgi:hypothetical protein
MNTTAFETNNRFSATHQRRIVRLQGTSGALAPREQERTPMKTRMVVKNCTLTLTSEIEKNRYTVSNSKNGKVLYKTQMQLDDLQDTGIFEQILKLAAKMVGKRK